MIGIIGAMDIEVEGIIKMLTDVKKERVSSIDFYVGKLNGKEIVTAVSGVGKVNSAVCCEAMIIKYSPECIINSGVAGGLAKDLNILDIAIADKVVEYDFDTSPLGDPVGFVSGIDRVYMECDKKVVDKLTEAVIKNNDTNYKTGTIASGDKFVNDNETRGFITDNFNAIANEMEGASIGHVCTLNGVPFGVIRVMSDNADSTSHMDYNTFKYIAADKSVNIIKSFVEIY